MTVYSSRNRTFIKETRSENTERRIESVGGLLNFLPLPKLKTTAKIPQQWLREDDQELLSETILAIIKKAESKEILEIFPVDDCFKIFRRHESKATHILPAGRREMLTGRGEKV